MVVVVVVVVVGGLVVVVGGVVGPEPPNVFVAHVEYADWTANDGVPKGTRP